MYLCEGVLYPCAGLHTGFFYGGGGGHTLVRPLGGLVACFPRKFFVFYVGL